MNIAAMEALAAKKVYISGAISQYSKEEVEEKFNMAEKVLSAAGYHVVNPIKLKHEHDGSWQSFMKEDIKALMECDIIWMLRCWKNSEGAKIERRLAMELKIEVRYEEGGEV